VKVLVDDLKRMMMMRKSVLSGLGILFLCTVVFTPLNAMAQGGVSPLAVKERSGTAKNTGDPLGTLALPSPATEGYGLADAGSNLFWHTATGPTNVVYLINTNGTVMDSFSVAVDTESANGIATDGTLLYIIDFANDEVDIYDTDGVFQSSFSMPFGIGGITYNPNTGNLYILDVFGGTVDERTTSGVLVNNTSVAGSLFPIGIDFDAQRNGYWVSDFTKGTADLYSLDFSVIRQSISTAPAASGIVVKGNKLYVVDSTTPVVLIFEISDFQLAAPFFLDNGTNLSGSMPTTGVACFIGVKNMSARSITLTITYTSDTGQDFTPVNNTFVLGPNQAVSWRPGANDPAEGGGQAVPNKSGGFPAGSVLITADGPITGRLVELDGDNSLSRAYTLPKP
jgi:hypothetical protein